MSIGETPCNIRERRMEVPEEVRLTELREDGRNTAVVSLEKEICMKNIHKHEFNKFAWLQKKLTPGYISPKNNLKNKQNKKKYKLKHMKKFISALLMYHMEKIYYL